MDNLKVKKSKMKPDFRPDFQTWITYIHNYAKGSCSVILNSKNN